MTYIFVDLDGVVSNFTKGVCDIFEKPYKEPESYDLYKELGVSEDEMWGEINSRRWKFWTNLELYPWANHLIEVVKELDPYFSFLTAPSLSADCVKGKRIWLKRHFPDENFVMAPAKLKCLLSQKGRILIDDKKRNIDDWISAGGKGILFPQPYNFEIGEKSVVDYVYSQIEVMNGR